ncbi:MAG: hypothetical protein AAGI44_18595 [Pseudomonadota bacterium]
MVAHTIVAVALSFLAATATYASSVQMYKVQRDAELPGDDDKDADIDQQ